MSAFRFSDSRHTMKTKSIIHNEMGVSSQSKLQLNQQGDTIYRPYRNSEFHLKTFLVRLPKQTLQCVIVL